MIYPSRYKNQKSIVLENEFLRVSLIPQYGAKIQSIISKKTGKEFLYQQDDRDFTGSKYGDSWGDGDKSGVDEIFPTINACTYPFYPWENTFLPCHGEVWSIPWETESDGKELKCSVSGVRLPYTLQKTVRLSENMLIQNYHAHNPTSFEMLFLWSMHPLLNCDEYSEIILPADVKEIICMYDGEKASGNLGSVGNINKWSITGTGAYMSKVLPKSAQVCDKFYINGNLTEGYCALHNSRAGDYFEILFTNETLPVLGVWINQGALQNQYNVALEPCTGGFDSLSEMERWGKISKLPAHGGYDWQTTIRIREKG